jgi:hypothetical protein
VVLERETIFSPLTLHFIGLSGPPPPHFSGGRVPENWPRTWAQQQHTHLLRHSAQSSPLHLPLPPQA